MGSIRTSAVLAALGLLWAGVADATALTADEAVKIALKSSTQVINAEAGIVDARGGLYGAWSGVLPRVSADLSRGGSWLTDRVGNQAIGGVVFPPRTTFESESYGTDPTLSGSWSVLNLSSFSGLSAARSALQAARLRRVSIRQDVVLSTLRQFYEVVKGSHLARVANGALRLARDDERRVKAMFEVGSVSKSDLLKAQVRSAQSELDSLTATQGVVLQRLALANLLGVAEETVAEIDTTLTAEAKSFDEAALLAEAEQNRPDLKAAEADLRSARANVRAARFARLPYLSLSGSASFRSKSTSRFDQPEIDTTGSEIPGTRRTSNTRSEADRSYSARIAVSWDLFDGLATDARNATARARLMRAEETRNALRRNLQADVSQALIVHREAISRDAVARRALDSAFENLKLTQEKYKVGSGTILELIDAQVQLQRAQNDQVTALASIRVAEAQINRVRGHGE
jgi:outer membrane protein TolC